MYIYRQVDPETIAVRWSHSQIANDAHDWVEIRQMPGIVGPLDGLLQYRPRLCEKLFVYDALGERLLTVFPGDTVLEGLCKLLKSTQYAYFALLVRVHKDSDGLHADLYRLAPGCIHQASELALEVKKFDEWLDATWRKPR